MKDKKVEFLIPFSIFSPKRSEILHKTISLGLVSKFKPEPGLIYKKSIFGLREFFFEKNNGFLNSEVFAARMEYVNAVWQPVWDYIWENKHSMNPWKNFNLVFREIFQDKDYVEYILVLKFTEYDWVFSFEKLNEYRFSEKDRAVCLVL